MAEQKKGPIKLGGGTVVKYDPNRPKIHPNADKPWLRFDPAGSGSLTLSMGTFALFKYLSTQTGGDPEPTLAELVIRRTPEAVYFELALTESNNPQAREFKVLGDYRVLRDVNVQVQAAGLQFDPGTLYQMDVFDAEDEEYQGVLAANWSTAETSPRPEKSETEEGKTKDTKAKDTAKAQDAKTTDTKGQVAAGKQDSTGESKANDSKTQG